MTSFEVCPGFGTRDDSNLLQIIASSWKEMCFQKVRKITGEKSGYARRGACDTRLHCIAALAECKTTSN